MLYLLLKKQKNIAFLTASMCVLRTSRCLCAEPSALPYKNVVRPAQAQVHIYVPLSRAAGYLARPSQTHCHPLISFITVLLVCGCEKEMDAPPLWWCSGKVMDSRLAVVNEWCQTLDPISAICTSKWDGRGCGGGGGISSNLWLFCSSFHPGWINKRCSRSSTLMWSGRYRDGGLKSSLSIHHCVF